jgi:hypothetical protein
MEKVNYDYYFAEVCQINYELNVEREATKKYSHHLNYYIMSR